jgi:hydrogenase nickel incorporation protein HypA/HybF
MAQAVREHFSRVHRVSLEVGELCSVAAEALAFCFDIVTQGTIAANARLDLVTVPGEGVCERCQRHCTVSSRVDLCPFCGAGYVDISGGDQILIKELEVE